MKKKEPKRMKKIFKKKPCRLCKDKVEKIEYMDAPLISRFVSERGRIMSPRISGNCSKHQRMVANCVKKARIAGILPFVRIKENTFRRRPRREE
ncbi:MAG: 30S ribosomal protein S18 [Candidatus Omnitrophica bacterium]|nr:30S ribosomal protein S18 [Candidatus Omnitrophota bacterium]